MVERRRRRRVADHAQHLAVVLPAVGHRGIGRVRHLEREVAQRGVELRELVLGPLQLRLELAGLGQPCGTLVGRCLADLLRDRVLARAERLDRGLLRALRGIGAEHRVDESCGHSLAFDRDPDVGVLAESTEVDHVPGGRICARRPSTQSLACFHASVATRRRSGASAPATGYDPRNFTSAWFAKR